MHFATESHRRELRRLLRSGEDNPPQGLRRRKLRYLQRREDGRERDSSDEIPQRRGHFTWKRKKWAPTNFNSTFQVSSSGSSSSPSKPATKPSPTFEECPAASSSAPEGAAAALQPSFRSRTDSQVAYTPGAAPEAAGAGAYINKRGELDLPVLLKVSAGRKEGVSREVAISPCKGVVVAFPPGGNMKFHLGQIEWPTLLQSLHSAPPLFSGPAQSLLERERLHAEGLRRAALFALHSGRPRRVGQA